MKQLALLSLILLFFASCDHITDKNSGPTQFTCSVECEGFNEDDKKHDHDIGEFDGIKVSLGGVISKSEVHSGTKSILLNQKNQYGLTAVLERVKVDEYYKVSIWRKDNSKKACLIVQGEIASILYKADKLGKVVDSKNGWEKLEIDFEVPPHTDEIKIYAWIAKGTEAYFDDLTIEKIKEKDYFKHKRGDAINVYFTENNINKFNQAKEDAYAEGVHFSDGNWNKGILSTTNGPIPIKARFKGDWLDHMEGQKWSLRIKTRKGNTYQRMKEFSVQTPESRYFLHEYVSHQLCFYEGLLTPRYEFAPLYLNRESRGVYAIEEHFAKQLVEFNLRREGPILKFDENPMWRNIALHKGKNLIKGWESFPSYEATRIMPFGSSSIEENELLKSKFLIAHSLLYQFKERTAPVEELFEIDKLSKYLALLDLHGGKHGAIWHNLRFYYNPITCKLEVINYDNFTSEFGKEDQDIEPLTALKFNRETELTKYRHFYTYFFTSKKLRESYIRNLEKYSNEAFINKFYASIKPKVEDYKALINVEFPEYTIDKNFLLENASTIRNELPIIKERHQSGFYDSLKIINLNDNYSERYFQNMFQYFVNAYYEEINDGALLRIENYTTAAVKPLRVLTENNRPLFKFNEERVAKEFRNGESTLSLELPYFKDAKFIEFAELDSNHVFKVEITPWRKNTTASPYQRLKHSEKSNPLQLFTAQHDTLILKKGRYKLTEKILIADNKTVVIEAGVELDLINKAAIISHAPVFFMGSAKHPIHIHSSDKSSNGIAVLQAKGKSTITYTLFKNMNTFSYDGWTLSGAVNFYESDVQIENSTFESNLCEDALNIIKSDFYVSKCHFKDIFADAFDSDFCTGTLSNTSFNRVGNDAIDFSTSQIKIDSCSIRNISDKGISGGEGSTLWVSNTTMDKCNIGAASKDLSEVYLTNVSISNSTYGLVALKKKQEYGAAKLITKDFSMVNCEIELLIEKGSTVNLNGRKIEGTKKKVAEMFY